MINVILFPRVCLGWKKKRKREERRKILGWVQTAMTSFADVDDVEAWNVLDVSRWRKIFPRRRPRG